MRPVLFAAVLAALTALAARPAHAQDSFRADVREVVSGSEIKVSVEAWRVSVRLHGIAAPVRSPFDLDAREYLRRRVGAFPVRVVVRGTAAKGVVYGDVFPEGAKEPVNRELVGQGLATWAAEYAPDRADIAEAQAAAQATRSGVWGARGETRMPPFNAPTPAPAPRVRSGASAPRSPAPAPTPRPAARRGVRATVAPFAPLLAAAFALCLGGAGIAASPVRRLARRRTLLVDARPGPIKIRGVAAPIGKRPQASTGRMAALFLHETAWRYTGNGWQKVRDDRDAISFTLDDGSGVAEVVGEDCAFHAARVARFYNGVPVEKWHEVPYPDDTRTEVRFVPAGAVVTVVGVYQGDPPRVEAGGSHPRVVVAEGDERRIARRSGALATALLLLAAACAATFAAVVG